MDAVIAIAALLLTLAGLALAYWLGRPGQRMARRQIAESRTLKIEIYRCPAEHVLWVLPWADNSAFTIGLEFSLINQGTQSIEDIRLELVLPSILYIPALPRNYDGGATLVDVQRGLVADDDLDLTTLIFRIPALHPNVRLNLREEIFLPNQAQVASYLETATCRVGSVASRWFFPSGWGIGVTASGQHFRAGRKLFKLFSYTSGDERLQLLRSPDLAGAALEARYRGGKRITAAVLTPEEIEAAPAHLRELFGKGLKEVPLRNVMCQPAVYFPEVGYLPVAEFPDRRSKIGKEAEGPF